MAKVNITLHGRDYAISCGPGEEDRLREVVRFVEHRLQGIVKKSGDISESRLFMLACLHLADELIEIKRGSEASRAADEDLLVTAVEHLQRRVATISSKIGHA